jgi:uncharacterized membrane protein (DUF2068 family)
MRTLPVTLIGFYQLLRGVIGVLFGLSILAFTGLAAKLASLAAEANAAQRFLTGLGHLAGLIVIVFAVLHLAAGYGLLQMENWGRLLTLLLSAMGLVLLVPGMLFMHAFSLAFGLINAASIFYLAMPSTRRAFGTAGRPLKMAA